MIPDKRLPAMPIRAYSYIRCSCKKQDRGDTRRRQLEWSEQKANERGFCLDDTLNLHDIGVSGFRGKNAAVGHLAAFLKAVDQGRVATGSVLLVESLDRLSRDYVDDAFDLFRRILKSGITIITRTPDREYNLESVRGNMLALLEPLFIFARSHDESETKSMRLREAWGEKKKSATADRTPHGVNAPAWVRLTSDGYALDARDARTVRAIFAYAREGLGIWRITGRLKADGHPTIGRSRRWSCAYVRKILRGRNAVGEYQPNRKTEDGRCVPDGEPVPGYYPAAVTETEWLLAQAAMDGRRGKTGRPGQSEANLFTGIIKEAHTGAPLMMQPSCPRDKIRRVYLMTGKAGATYVNYQHVEASVLSALDQLTPRDVVDDPGDVDERSDQIDELTRERVALAHRLEVLQARAADAATQPEEMEALFGIIRTVTARKEAAGRELDTLKLEVASSRTEALAEMRTVLELIQEAKGTPQEEELRRRVKALIRQLVGEIRVKSQRFCRGCQVVHIQIWLRNGGMRYLQILPGKPVERADWSAVDFRDEAGTKPTLHTKPRSRKRRT